MRAVRRNALAIMVAGMALMAFAMAGCSRAATSTASQAVSAPTSTAATGNGVNSGAATGGAGSSSPSQNVEALDKPPEQTGQQLVSTATMTVQVDDVVAAKQKATALLTGLDPANELFAEQTSLTQSATSTVTFKVAPAKFSAALDQLAGLGKLTAQEVKTDDVTQQVVDLDARIKAAEDSTARVTDLLSKTSSVTELAQVEDELTKREADLESLRGQQRTLSARTELATVVVTLTTVVPPTAIAEASATPLPGFLDGLRGGWEAFVKVMTVGAAVVGALLPFVWIPLVLVFGWRMLRRRRGPSPQPQPAPASAA
jgi:hypothetical protein